ncbi:MAG: TIGR01777 family oxidoreductase [Gemmatimonadaceae bacterium]
MRVAVSGSTGLIGTALVESLRADGHGVVRLVRGSVPAGSDDVVWDPMRDALHPDALDGVDAVVHLAGESIAERWTDEHRRRIVDSRVRGTSLLARTLAGLARPPRVLVSASAVGIYGDGGDRVLDESTATGTGFLADVARAWEGAADPARAAGIRVAHPRFGIVLSPRGGMIARLMLPFRLGVGGRVGSGRQWQSWVALHDTVRAIRFIIDVEALAGPVNVTSPYPVTNEELARTLARVLGRPSFAFVPAFALRLAFGEMAEEVLLAGQRVAPKQLLDAGFQFHHPVLEEALRFELGQARR